VQERIVCASDSDMTIDSLVSLPSCSPHKKKNCVDSTEANHANRLHEEGIAHD
jgi:hypothetical protein